MEFLRLAWKNLWRNRRRTLITLAAISLSVMLTQASHNLSFGVYAQMIDSGVRAGSGHLTVYRGDYALSRKEELSFDPETLVEEIAAIDGVARVLPRIYLPALAQSSRESRGVLVTGVDPQAEAGINPFLKKIVAGEMIRSSDGRDALLGSRLLKELKISIGSKFVVTLQGPEGDLLSELLRVRGSVETGIKDLDGSLVMIGRQRAAAMAGIPGRVHELAVILEGRTEEERVRPRLEALLLPGGELRVLSWEEAMPNLANAIKLDYAGQRVIFIIIMLIVTIGVINTLLMSVMERIREFGVILALGATPGRLRRMVLAEALVLGLVAMTLGTILGAALTWYLVEYGIDLRSLISETLEFGGVVFDPVMRAAWDPGYMVRIALYVLALSLLASLYPARKAARIAPAEAMRHV
jgi:ABC-type lipoprotein release transport system permease subunit